MISVQRASNRRYIGRAARWFPLPVGGFFTWMKRGVRLGWNPSGRRKAEETRIGAKGKAVLTLFEVVSQLDSLPDEKIIYATRINGQWVAESPAFVEQEPDDGYIKQVFHGVETEYLLEADLAKEVVEVYQDHYGKSKPSVEEKLKAIIYYAERDCYLPFTEVV